MLTALALPASTEASFPGQNGKIAFVAGNDIHTINADGTGTTNLTNDAATDSSPSWSPDGMKIVFASDSGSPGIRDLYTMNADGSGRTNITHSTGDEFLPAWSPDGRRIAFTGDPGDGSQEIFVIRADGTGQTNLTNNNFFLDQQPAWSPDGQKIAFITGRGDDDFDLEIYVMNADGSGQTNVTRTPGGDFEPSWFPGGNRIAFHSQRSPLGLYTMSPDGTAQTRLSPGRDPAPAPDGARIAFELDGALYVEKSDGTEAVQIASGFAHAPDWQPLIGHPRPMAAAQLRVPLAVAHRACTAPNLTHGPALDAASCNPGLPESSWLTTGTMDANGFPEQMNGSLRMTVCKDGRTATGSCGPPVDPSNPDVRIEVEVTDVRCAIGSSGQSQCEGGALSDYVGQLQGIIDVRLTDRHNNLVSGGTGDSGTVVNIPFPVRVGCVSNPAGGAPTAVGATCATVTSVNAIVPRALQRAKRGNWELEPVRLFDGGQDGVAGAVDATLFLTQGIFVL